MDVLVQGIRENVLDFIIRRQHLNTLNTITQRQLLQGVLQICFRINADLADARCQERVS